MNLLSVTAAIFTEAWLCRVRCMCEFLHMDGRLDRIRLTHPGGRRQRWVTFYDR